MLPLAHSNGDVRMTTPEQRRELRAAYLGFTHAVDQAEEDLLVLMAKELEVDPVEVRLCWENIRVYYQFQDALAPRRRYSAKRDGS